MHSATDSTRLAGKNHLDDSRMSGFSLIETLIVLSLMMIASGIFFMSLQPALKDTRVTNAYNATLMTMRRARGAGHCGTPRLRGHFQQRGCAQTRSRLRARPPAWSHPPSLCRQILPSGSEPGIPTTLATTPDHFGTGSPAIDFDQGVAGGAKNVICFNPDGSAQDINSNTNNGVIYMARSGSLYTARAITVWGSTGRLRGYRLYPKVGGGSIWRQQ